MNESARVKLLERYPHGIHLIKLNALLLLLLLALDDFVPALTHSLESASPVFSG